MAIRVAYGKRSKISDAIATGVIPKDCLIVTSDAEESELYFYDAAGQMKHISERKQFDTVGEAQAWVKTYDCAGHIISVLNGSDWVPYIVTNDGVLTPVDSGSGGIYADIKGDGKSIEIVDGEVSLKDFNSATAGQQLRVNAAGTALEWYTPGIDAVPGLVDALGGKVDKAEGKGLSTNDFTDEAKAKLDGMGAGANRNLIEIVRLNGTALDIHEKAVNIPVAGTTAGVVVSSVGENKVAVAEDGSMEVNSLNMSKLVQSEGDTLILNSGNASV